MADSRTAETQETHTTVNVAGNGQQVSIPSKLPVLPVRNIVVFPGTVMPLNVGRSKSKAMLEEAMAGEKMIAIVTQLDAEVNDPTREQLHDTGVACMILKLVAGPDQQQSIIVHGLTRIALQDLGQTTPFLSGRFGVLKDKVSDNTRTRALMATVRQQANRVIELSPSTPDEAKEVLNSIDNPSALADFLAANVQADTSEKMRLLAELDVEARLTHVSSKLAQQLDVLEIQSRIQSEVRESIDKTQRHYYLREQMKAIRKELGEEGGETSDVERLRERLEAASPPEHVMKEAGRELNRLESIPQASPEYGVIRTYLQIISELPWAKSSEGNIDLDESQRILDRDHHDLDKVKRRILEYLAVRKLKPDGGGAILCFVGPPGVGKTSLGMSIATATGRNFIRVALGGVRDESEIRGHRRTYIGAMPGRIISEFRKCGTNNPVMMLDEIDKVGADFRGDPNAALLEVLDPAQNHSFTDHYLDLPFDLSKTLFIATANTMDTVPGPLRDRMEVIEIPGYTETDKLSIARRYLVPRQLEANGLKKKQATFQQAALKLIIEKYTREAGVRNLERNIGGVCRAIAAEVVGGKTKKVSVDEAYVREKLGPERYVSELAQRTAVPGVATGMAYTPVGGEILFIEGTRMAGKGGITLTGQIGDVMKESATAAFSLVRSRAEELGVDPKQLAESDIHLHVPAGAVPKDGPSAGVAMFTALASLLLNKPVRHDVAMTGEITLRGLVLPIGGLKEKTLAALRAGIKEVIVPARNEKDFPELPDEAKKGLKFHFVNTVDEVLAVAMASPAAKPTAKPTATTRAKARKPKPKPTKRKPAAGRA
ncbi:MAG: endopeptidase La [Phycisphaerae bacterium]